MALRGRERAGAGVWKRSQTRKKERKGRKEKLPSACCGETGGWLGLAAKKRNLTSSQKGGVALTKRSTGIKRKKISRPLRKRKKKKSPTKQGSIEAVWRSLGCLARSTQTEGGEKEGGFPVVKGAANTIQATPGRRRKEVRMFSRCSIKENHQKGRK